MDNGGTAGVSGDVILDSSCAAGVSDVNLDSGAGVTCDSILNSGGTIDEF